MKVAEETLVSFSKLTFLTANSLKINTLPTLTLYITYLTISYKVCILEMFLHPINPRLPNDGPESRQYSFFFGFCLGVDLPFLCGGSSTSYLLAKVCQVTLHSSLSLFFIPSSFLYPKKVASDGLYQSCTKS